VLALDLLEGEPIGELRFGVADLGERDVEAGAGGEDDRAFDEVLEFPDIAGPRPGHQGAKGVGRDGGDGPVHEAAVFADEVAGEGGDVLGMVAEGRGGEGEDFEAVIQVAAEEVVAHHLGEVAVGGGDEADVDGDGFGAAEAFKGLLLEGAEELGLEFEGNVADFIEEEGAVVGHFEAADLLAERAGEGAAFVAEEFAFEEAGGDGGAVESDEGLGGAGAEAMDGAGDEFLAGAGFAEDEDGGVGGGDEADLAEEAADDGAAADEFGEVLLRGGVGGRDGFEVVAGAEVLDEGDPAERGEGQDGGGDEDRDGGAGLGDELRFKGGAGAEAEALFMGELVLEAEVGRGERRPGEETRGQVLAAIADELEEGIVGLGDAVVLAGDGAGDGGLDGQDGAGLGKGRLGTVAEVADDLGEAAE